jgi:hypothetical protein
MGRSVLFALFVGLVALLPCKALEVIKWVEEGKGAELVVGCAWNVVVLCAALDLMDVAVGETGRVVETVGTVVDLAFDNVVVDRTALDVC